MIRIALVGAAGRMGQAVRDAADSSGEMQIGATVELGESIEERIGGCDAVIDFSQPAAIRSIVGACVTRGKPLVIGTTGHSDAQMRSINDAATKIAVLRAPNFSIGVNALFWLTRKAAELLGSDFDVEVVEMHHRMKKDAPSGTARRLAEILCDVRELDYHQHVRHGREGIVGARPPHQIGVHAIRGGDVVGDHTVIFAAPGERLELTHKASSRETFAIGALRAAQWITGKPAGLYDMEDVLGLR